MRKITYEILSMHIVAHYFDNSSNHISKTEPEVSTEAQDDEIKSLDSVTTNFNIQLV